MGSNLHGFDIRLEFDPNGDVAEVFYEDAEGCGYERLVAWDDSVWQLVQYHLDHYRRSHNTVPRVWCPEQATLPDGSVTRCMNAADQPHEEHTFTWRKR